MQRGVSRIRSCRLSDVRAGLYTLTGVLLLWGVTVPWAALAQDHPPCPDGQEWDGGLCYDACQEGYEGVGPICWESCPLGSADWGLLCFDGSSFHQKQSYGRGAGTAPSPVFAKNRNRCPDGQEWDVTSRLCYDACQEGYYGISSTCWQRCPAGYTDDGALCRKDAVIVTKASYGRGAGAVPDACPAGQEKDGGLCYNSCSAGYDGVGPVCWEQCAAGYRDDGASCYKDLLHWYFKKSYGRGAGTVPGGCPAGQDKDGGLCYNSCQAGYVGIGPVCWQQGCPAGYTDDGALCRKNADIFAKDSYDRGAGDIAPCGGLGRQYDTSYNSVLSQYTSATTFTLLIASDPQLSRWSGANSPACAADDDACKLRKSKQANADQVDAMNTILQAQWTVNGQQGGGTWPVASALTHGAGAPIAAPLGVIMNGDLTEYWQDYQVRLYRRYYEPGFVPGVQHVLQAPIFPGLGNHDYDNNVGDCYGLSPDKNHCAKKAVQYIKNMVYYDAVSNFINTLVQHFDEKSLAYSWDIGTYHFVQLNNYPTYTEAKTGIESAISWLKADLASATTAGKRIVLNFHDADFGTYLDHVKLQDPAFLDAIQNTNVVAVFTGHYHDYTGYFGEIPGTTIPHFRSGASENNTFLLVEFGDTYINVGVIESDGRVPRFADPTNPTIPSSGPRDDRPSHHPQGRQMNLYTIPLH